MRSTPAVSVIIPAYNVTPYIGDALTSVFAQTFADYEVIVVNDGCPDSENLERTLEPYRSRITYLRQVNGGPSVARNTGVLHARAPLIALLDADDVWLPAYLAHQVGVMEQDAGVDVSYTNSTFFGTGPLVGSLAMEHTRSEGEPTFEALVEQRCVVLNCALIRRDAIMRAGLWYPPMRYSEDFDLWLRIAHQGRIVYTRAALTRTRIRPGSLSRSARAMYTGQLQAYRRALTLPLTRDQEDLIRRMIRRTSALESLELAKEAFWDRDFAKARHLLCEAEPVMSRKQRLFAKALGYAPWMLFRVALVRKWLMPRYQRIE